MMHDRKNIKISARCWLKYGKTYYFNSQPLINLSDNGMVGRGDAPTSDTMSRKYSFSNRMQGGI
jgi:hypothetical protein